MIKTAMLVLVTAFFFFVQLYFQGSMTLEHNDLPQAQAAVVLPIKVLDVAALDYKSLVSDLVFLGALNRFGKTLERDESGIVGSQVKDWEWQVLFEEIELALAMDPYFLDPYYFANSILTYNAQFLLQVNLLLEEGAGERYWDWELPFYVGYNYFFEFNQPQEASRWLMDAAQRSTSKSSVLTTLAARLAYEGDETENAIVFLRQMLASASDEMTRSVYEMRLKSLEGIFFMEKALDVYANHFGTRAKSLADLISVGILHSIPVDPYGGEYFLDKDGKVKTTSGLRPMN